MKPQVSLFASAARPEWWMRLYNSLSQNTVSWEIVFVGPNPPKFTLPENFKYFYSKCKPAQCYMAAAYECEGEVIGWTADDASYNEPIAKCPNALDSIWQNYQDSIKQYGDKKTIFSQITIEDYKDTGHADWIHHRFFYGDHRTPAMAPLGYINREFFFELQGYDKQFIAGQSENAVCMSAFNAGGRVQTAKDSKVFLHHGQCHAQYPFRRAYFHDRKVLEDLYVKEGFGTYEKKLPYTLLSKPSRTHDAYDRKNILTIPQGPQGDWAI